MFLTAPTLTHVDCTPEYFAACISAVPNPHINLMYTVSPRGGRPAKFGKTLTRAGHTMIARLRRHGATDDQIRQLVAEGKIV